MESPIGTFFLDSCILLNRVLGENPKRTKKLFDDMSDHAIECYLSTSVYGECEAKIISTIDYIGNFFRVVFQGAFGYLLEQQSRTTDDQFQKKDILLVQNIFRDIGRQEGVLTTPAKSLEEFIVHVAENKLESGEAFTFKELILGLTLEAMRLTNTLNDRFENLFLVKKPKLNVYSDIPNSDLVDQLKDNGIHEPDNDHLASSKFYEEKTSHKTVFVTDDNGVLKRMYYLQNRMGITTSDPLYAIHHL